MTEDEMIDALNTAWASQQAYARIHREAIEVYQTTFKTKSDPGLLDAVGKMAAEIDSWRLKFKVLGLGLYRRFQSDYGKFAKWADYHTNDTTPDYVEWLEKSLDYMITVKPDAWQRTLDGYDDIPTEEE